MQPVSVADKNVDERNDDYDDIKEVYAGMTKSEIEAVDCEAQKTRGNASFFLAGEYAQAILLYTLTLDHAAELPDAGGSKKQLFPRHVVLSNRSASLLKLTYYYDFILTN